MGGGEINQVSHELGQLTGRMKGLEGWVEQIARDVEGIKASANERKGLLELLLDKVDAVGAGVAHLNDVERKLQDVGLRLDDAENHRKDQLALRRWRRFAAACSRVFESAIRHGLRALVVAVVLAIAAFALSQYPHAWRLVSPALEHLFGE